MSWQQVDRRLRRTGRRAIRRVRPSERGTMPDFIVIGAQKAGTTSLFEYLAQHPQILPARRKEVHYFDGGLNPVVDRYAKGVDWYRRQFPDRPRFGGHKAFEASPFYLYSPFAAGRMSEALPDVRLITMVRDPVDRAISHYFHSVRRGAEPLPIAAAMAAEEQRLEADEDSRHRNGFAHRAHSYKSRGRYYDQLQRYHQHFRPEKMLVLSSEQLAKNTDETLRRVFEFVGVDANYAVADQAPHNVGPNRAPVDDEVKDYLADYFRPHNQRFYALVGEDYGWRS